MVGKAKKAGVVLLAVVGIAQGQQESDDSDVDVECDSSMNWMNNAKEESPCQVARNLILQCAPPSVPVTLPPLQEANETFYANLWGNEKCSCNTVVYNLISGCELCQGFEPQSFSDWIQPCPSSSVSFMDYPDAAIAESFNTPTWAYVNTTKAGEFNVREAKEVAGGKTKAHWSTIQILAPVITAVAVSLIALGIFFWYRRRVKKRYMRIGDQSLMNNNRHVNPSSSSLLTLRSFVVGSSSSDRSSTTTSARRHKGKAVAWQTANLQAPRKLGGLFSNRPRVHNRTRGADWSIDTDDIEFDDLDPLHPSSSSTLNLNNNESGNRDGNGSGSTPTPSFGSSQGQQGSDRTRRGNNSSSNGTWGSDSAGLRPIQDAPDTRDLNNVRPTQGVDRRRRPPPVHVVSTPPQRGFNLDDVDSAGTPTPVAPRPPPSPVNAGEEEGGTRGRERMEGRSEVLLISRTPGEDFHSTVVTSPVDTDGTHPFAASRQDSAEQYPPALTDDSPILRPSLSRDRTNFHPSSLIPTIRHSPPPDASLRSQPQPQSKVVRPKPSDPQMLVPASVRAAGYSPSPSPSPKLNTRLALPEVSHYRTISEPNLPTSHGHDFSTNKPSNDAARKQKRHSSTMFSDVASSRSSEYNVPNPFRLDPRKPYGAPHLSPIAPAMHASFRDNRPDGFDLDA